MSEMKFFKRGQFVRVKLVDMYGHLGRDSHPDKTDIGRIGRVEEVDFLDPETGMNVRYKDVAAWPFGEPTVLYRVVFDDGRALELLDEEVEAASSSVVLPKWFVEEIPSYATV